MLKSYYIRVCVLFSSILLVCNIFAAGTSFAEFVAIENFDYNLFGFCAHKYKYNSNNCGTNKELKGKHCGGKYEECVCKSQYVYTSSNCFGDKEPTGSSCQEGGVTKYASCGCKSQYRYTSSNCFGDMQPSGDSCTDSGGEKFSECVCNPEKFQYTSCDDGKIGKTACVSLGQTRFEACVCNTAVYKETAATCGVLNKVPAGAFCTDSETKYETCECGTEYRYTEADCANDGDKIPDGDSCYDTVSGEEKFKICKEKDCVPDAECTGLPECPEGLVCSSCDKGCSYGTLYEPMGCSYEVGLYKYTLEHCQNRGKKTFGAGKMVDGVMKYPRCVCDTEVYTETTCDGDNTVDRQCEDDEGLHYRCKCDVSKYTYSKDDCLQEYKMPDETQECEGLYKECKFPEGYMCTKCKIIYDPVRGDLERGVEPGTKFEDIEDSWEDVNGHGKEDYEPCDGACDDTTGGGGNTGGGTGGTGGGGTMGGGTSPGEGRYKCSVCGYVYDPENGDPDNGVPSGTTFEALPEGWICPLGGESKDQFEEYSNG